jgi:hypothetical protein
MSETIQISTHISFETKKRMDRYLRNSGVSREHLIEHALEHHLQALEEIPENFITPTRLVLSSESASLMRALTEKPPAPTEALKKMFDDR